MCQCVEEIMGINKINAISENFNAGKNYAKQLSLDDGRGTDVSLTG